MKSAIFAAALLTVGCFSLPIFGSRRSPRCHRCSPDLAQSLTSTHRQQIEAIYLSHDRRVDLRILPRILRTFLVAQLGLYDW